MTTAAISERAQEALARGMKTLSGLDTMKGLEAKADILRALDPSLDVWAEVHGDSPDFALGRRAWHLAVLSGLEDVVLSSQDIAELLGVAQKTVRDFLARMATVNCLLVQKVRQGRSFVYEIRWAKVFRQDGEYWDDRVSRHKVRDSRAERDRKVQEASARRGTPAGYLAYRLSTASPKRDEYLEVNPLLADADKAWRALVEAGDEMALYEPPAGPGGRGGARAEHACGPRERGRGGPPGPAGSGILGGPALQGPLRAGAAGDPGRHAAAGVRGRLGLTRVDDVPGGLAAEEGDDTALLHGLERLVQQLRKHGLVGAGVVQGPGVQRDFHGCLSEGGSFFTP
ncbi:hypothetical protein KVH22_25655 [Streptomyces olivaceus]|uniref:hypothetical protein n=1 Tax=Streptomyces olivaceus TaxID=47716 RepID=UPI001CCF7E4C|nr:hypothetical protein [Streptomyces olivaceus]MBZ6258906.1 hypothetical protein [Streptomyces olivaceus]